jgi:hypothetical protein
MWHIHKTECYSALRRNGILTRATKWEDLEAIVSFFSFFYGSGV